MTAPLNDLELIPIIDEEALRRINCHLAPATLRKMSSQGTYPRLMLTLNRRIYLDAKEWRAVLADAIAERDARAAKIEERRHRNADPNRPRRGRPRNVAKFRDGEKIALVEEPAPPGEAQPPASEAGGNEGPSGMTEAERLNDSEKCDRLAAQVKRQAETIMDYRRRMRAASSSLRSIPGDRDPNVSDAIALLTDAPDGQGEKA